MPSPLVAWTAAVTGENRWLKMESVYMPRSLGRKIHLLFFTMLLGALSAETAEIEFKPNAGVAGSFVQLGDIAKVSDPDAALVEMLSRLELFPAPSAKEPRLVRAGSIRQLLELHGLKAEEHRFTGATLIRITRSRASSTTSTTAPVKQPEPPAEQHFLVFTKRNLAAGEVVNESDVELRVVEKPPTGSSGFAEIKSAIGQEVTRAFAANQPLDVRYLRNPILVQRGQTISVVARAAGVRARTTARATQDGARGDVILVESLDTKQKFSVMVTDRQQVEVLASALPADAQRMATRRKTQD